MWFRRVAVVLVPSLLTAVAFIVGSRFGVVGDLPLWALLSLLFVAGVLGEIVGRYADRSSSTLAMHVGLAVRLSAVTVVIYAIGWGPTMALGYIFVGARALEESGPRAWPFAVVWSAYGIVFGQVAIALGLVRSYVPAPYVHGMAGLAILGTAFVMHLLGTKTAQNETALSLLNATLDSTADGILVVDNDGAISQYNSQFVEMWQLPDAIMARREDNTAIQFVLDQLVRPETFIAKVEELYASPESESNDTLEFKDGRVLERHSRPQRLDGRVVGRVWSFRDVTDRNRLLDELAHQAFHDSLTGLANRALLRDRLEHAIARARRSGATVVVLFCDLDRFKMVNDTLGHDAGDVLLVEVAQRFQHNLREADTAARVGGDEFAILLDEATDRDAPVVAQRLLDALREPFIVNGREVFIRASIGIADNHDDALDADELLCRADIAMYSAKSRGRDRIAVFQRTMQTELTTRHELFGDLRHALLEGQLSVHYQPLIDLEARTIESFEALVRWNHPVRGFIPPDEFIPIAEESGLILELGRFVLNEACRQTARWREQAGLDELSISVNVSGHQLYDDQFVQDVERALLDTKLPANRLILELTESTLLTDTATVHRRLQELKNLGVRLAIDDFGTGYSSLSYLHSFPVDYLKIDRSFVNSLNEQRNHQGRVMVRSIISIAHNLQLGVVAEGIERPDQLDELVDAGCNTGQGFLFARPGPADIVSELLGELNVRPAR